MTDKQLPRPLLRLCCKSREALCNRMMRARGLAQRHILKTKFSRGRQVIHYALPGNQSYQEQLYPDPQRLRATTRAQWGLNTYADVIRHFTQSSLAQDGIAIEDNSLHVDLGEHGYTVRFTPTPGSAQQAEQFARMHKTLLDHKHYGLALDGARACQHTPAWNPMAGYPVNRSDGPSEWLPCLPQGMPLVNHRAVTLMHYPPIVAYQTADYLNNMTLHRWAQVLACAGIAQNTLYQAIVDVNPIAAPGSGESEYPNDYFPISLTAQFFDDASRDLHYVRSVLECMLNPESNAAHALTLPLLVCGSPLYDPQAPGWFRTRYKDQLPKDKNGSPSVDVLQTGLIRLNPDSPKLTPYMVANHMIAAGVTGRCTPDASKIPDIRKYEAQDLVAATWLSLCAQAQDQGQPFDPVAARTQACQRWFGAPDGSGAPVPPAAEDRLTICALGQMDLCFDPVKIAPLYTYAQALERCKAQGGADASPCFGCGCN